MKLGSNLVIENRRIAPMEAIKETARLNMEKASGRARYSTAFSWVVLLIGLVVSGVLFVVTQNIVENVARLRFERQAGDAKSIIDDRINFYADILYGLKALFASHGPISRVQFHKFVQSLDLIRRYPGFDVVNFMTYVPEKDKRRFEESVRKDTSLEPSGYPNFAIKPPGERPGYYVLVYVEPMQGFEFSFGLDLGANPEAKDPKAMASAVLLTRDSGQLTASGLPLRIKSRGKEYIGLAMRLAVYRDGMPIETVEQRRAAFLGSVGAGFNVEKLMQGVLDAEKTARMRFRLYDAGPASDRSVGANAARRLLFDSNSLIKDASSRLVADEERSVFTRVLAMEVGGRIWHIDFSAPKVLVIGRVDAILPWMVLVVGLLASTLLFGMFHSLASSRRRAVEIANQITKDLRESESSLAEAQHIAHLGNWSLDPITGHMTWSAETYRIFGLDPMPGLFACSDLMKRVHEEDRAVLRREIHHAMATGQDCEIDYRIVLDDGSVRWVHTIAQSKGGVSHSPMSGTIMDITARKLAEQELFENRALLNDAQKLSHVGCWQYNPRDRRLIWTEEVYRIFGVDAQTFEPSFETALKLVHPEDRNRVERAIDTAWQTGHGFTMEYRIVQPNGTIRYLRSLGEVVSGAMERPVSMLGSILDITEQKDAEDALRDNAEQLAALSRRLVEVQEIERRQFSRELHDRIGQNLTALSINLDIMRTQLSSAEHSMLLMRLDDSSVLLESTAGSVDNLLSELRPPMLDDYGLFSALQWYGNEFARRTGINVKVHGNEQMARLAATTEIALFRIAQEALNNVAKHAHASSVDIELKGNGAECTLLIADDGVGFDGTSSTIGRRRPGLGMVTMRERTQTISGQFEVSATPGSGTQIVVKVPSLT